MKLETWDDLIQPINKHLFEKTSATLLITTTLTTLLYLSTQGHVLGIDGWYWVQLAYRNQPWIGNAFSTIFFTSPFIILGFTENKKHNHYFIATLMAINLFTVKSLVPEIDDYIILITAYLAITYTTNTFKHRITRHASNTVLVGLSITTLYIILQGWIPFEAWFIKHPEITHGELTVQLSNFFGYLPLITLLMWNKKWKPLLAFTTLFLMYPFPKFAVTAMIPLVYAIHTDFLKDQDFTYPQLIIGLLLIAPIIALPIRAIDTVHTNEATLEKYCNPDTHICNPPPRHWDKGHYYAHKGYMTNQPYEYGTCLCRGEDCIQHIITCGDREYDSHPH